jgi:beta-phosphoglucomutase-like phosphatase (HAD superfamily)
MNLKGDEYMVRQNVSDLKLVIIELDGCLFPLNHYRYNFYKNLCKKQNVSMDRQTFYEALGNMYAMYDALPLAHSMDSAQLNDKVEKDLYNYLKMKDHAVKDGALEFLEYLRQKNIKIAVVTTHKTKNAIAYLEMGHIYNKVDYVIGNDTKLQPLPATDIFEFLMNKYQVTPVQTLLVTSLISLLETGKETGMNMIYMEDLVPAGEKEKSLSYATCKSLYEALNDVIFGRYEDYKMYESILGLDENMSPEELRDVRIRLEDLYKDDDSLLDIVNKTYEFRLSELNVDPLSLEPERKVDDSDHVPEVAEVVEEEPTQNVNEEESAASLEPESEAESEAASEVTKPEKPVYESESDDYAQDVDGASIEDILGALEQNLNKTEQDFDAQSVNDDHLEAEETSEAEEEAEAVSEPEYVEEESEVESEAVEEPESEAAYEEPYEEVVESASEEPYSEEPYYEETSEENEPEDSYSEDSYEEVNVDSESASEEAPRNEDFGDTIIYTAPKEDKSYEDTGILSLDPAKTIELDDVLSKVMARNEENFADDDKAGEDFLIQEEEQPVSKFSTVINVIINILYTFALSLVILIIGLVIYIALQDQFEHGVLQFIANMYDAYSGFASLIVKGVMNFFHMFLPFVPSYSSYVNASEDAASLINVYILDTIIIAIVEILIFVFRPKDDDDDYYY